jgi:copper homeostasis protein
MTWFTIEVCANSPESCKQAKEGGAHRVELCAGIPEGGTTPSYGAIALAREIPDLKLNVIIRPRGGDFLYSGLEMEAMIRDIGVAKTLGADAVVFGCLTAQGDIDVSAMKRLMTASQGLSVTCHRAFDVCRDPFKALEDLVALGVDRILTSGQQNTAAKGSDLIAELVKRAGDRIIVMPGCGVNEHNIVELATKTKAKEFHMSLRSVVKSGMEFRNGNVSMGGTVNINEYEREVTDPARVASVFKALNAL